MYIRYSIYNFIHLFSNIQIFILLCISVMHKTDAALFFHRIYRVHNCSQTSDKNKELRYAY